MTYLLLLKKSKRKAPPYRKTINITVLRNQLLGKDNDKNRTYHFNTQKNKAKVQVEKYNKIV